MVIAFFIFLIFLFAPSKIAASESTVVLNEIYPPTTSDWVELYNTSSAEIDLGDWKLLDTATTPMKVLEGNKKISPKGFLVIEVSSRLNKSGDTIKLIDKDGVEADSYKYSTSSENESFARIPDGSGSWFGNQNPTKEASNGTSPPKDTKQSYPKVSLSEVFPNPEKGGDEWVEIYNPGSTKFDLTNWKLTDAANHAKALSGEVGGKSYKVFRYPSGWLNNSGDTLNLTNPTGKLIEKYSFGSIDKGLSIAKDAGNKWRVTTSPTPGKPNTITGQISNAMQENSISTQPDGDTLTASGLDPAVDYLGETFTLSDSTDQPIPRGKGKVAGVSEQKDTKDSLTTLLIAAGFAFLGTAVVWPFLEKKKRL